MCEQATAMATGGLRAQMWVVLTGATLSTTAAVHPRELSLTVDECSCACAITHATAAASGVCMYDGVHWTVCWWRLSAGGVDWPPGYCTPSS